MKQLPIYYSIDDIQRDYERTNSGHWFDKDTMRFFSCRLTSHFRKLNDTTYLFITTEKQSFDNHARVANVRICRIEPCEGWLGYKLKIESIGDEGRGLTIARAKTIMKNYEV